MKYALVHNNGVVIQLSKITESSYPSTTATLFEGTKEECEAEIERLRLEYVPEEEA